METNHECEVCGGKEFAVDAGYYYCEECGTRAKEIQEVQYELSQPVSSLRVRGKKIKKSSSSKSKGKNFNRSVKSLMAKFVYLFM